MTITVSHKRHNNNLLEKSITPEGFGPGVRVMLEGLSSTPLVYKGESWTNPSLFNGHTAKIIRLEKEIFWIVELECNQLVRILARSMLFCPFNANL
jgi:hypothetical protein